MILKILNRITPFEKISAIIYWLTKKLMWSMILNFWNHIRISFIYVTKLWDAYNFRTKLVIHSLTWLLKFTIWLI